MCVSLCLSLAMQVYKPGAGLGFHFDKDEHLLKATGQVQHPVCSSILYLTGNSSSSSSTLPAHEQQHHAQPTEVQPQPQHQPQQQQQAQQQRPDLSTLRDWDGVRQAPTVILDQQYDQQAGCPVPAAPSSSMVVWPLKGTYCLFDGRLGHGVLDSCSSSIRATLLVNWWTSCPQVGWVGFWVQAVNPGTPPVVTGLLRRGCGWASCVRDHLLIYIQTFVVSRTCHF